MKKETVLKVALAALMHDMGKFAQESLVINNAYRTGNADLYQPFYNGRHSHEHALYTAAFIEQMADFLPLELNAPQWGEGDAFISLAAAHHKPATPMQWIISQADRISSGLDRASFEEGERIAPKDYRKTRLLPILEALDPDRKKDFSSSDSYRKRYPLESLSPKSIFPVPRDAADKEDHKKAYARLFNTFLERLRKLCHRDAIALWAQHFDSLFMEYTALIPAARVGDVVHDISLYDHSRTTAALAAALYAFHEETDSMEIAAVKTGKEKKLLLLTGDFYGIQNFIFSTGGETAKNRSKLLRGRSFAVSVYSELAADLICEKTGMPFFSIVLNAAGKFTMVLPNTPKVRAAVLDAEKDINDWFFKISYGELSMGLAMTEASPDDFEQNSFCQLWNDRHMKDCWSRKQSKLDPRYLGVVETYLDQFKNDFNKPLCPFCRKRPSEVREGEKEICRTCNDHLSLGENLVRKSRLAVKSGKSLQGSLMVFDRYQLKFTETGTDGEIIKLWDLEIPDGKGELATRKRINGYIPVYEREDSQDPRLAGGRGDERKEGLPKNFDDLAALARNFGSEGGKPKGLEALGVLKADMDNLGLVMACGLPDERFTISRLATLSRQLDGFFTEYIPALLSGETGCSDFKNVYTVFSGGDDLFLIGPWNKMLPLAKFLREQFHSYVCENDLLSFSAGISLHKSHTPVDKLAEGAEEALQASKNLDGKNALTLFSATTSWKNVEALLAYRDKVEEWLEAGILGSAMVYRLAHLMELSEKERAIREGRGTFLMEDLDCLKWRSSLGYALARNVDEKKMKYPEKTKGEMAGMQEWFEKYGGELRIPFWSLMYDNR